MASEDVPTLRALIDNQRRIVNGLQKRAPAVGMQEIATAIDKLSTLERLASDMAREGAR